MNDHQPNHIGGGMLYEVERAAPGISALDFVSLRDREAPDAPEPQRPETPTSTDGRRDDGVDQ